MGRPRAPCTPPSRSPSRPPSALSPFRLPLSPPTRSPRFTSPPPWFLRSLSPPPTRFLTFLSYQGDLPAPSCARDALRPVSSCPHHLRPPPGDAFYCGQHPRHPRRALGPCSSASRSPGQHPRRASPRLDASLRQQRH